MTMWLISTENSFSHSSQENGLQAQARVFMVRTYDWPHLATKLDVWPPASHYKKQIMVRLIRRNIVNKEKDKIIMLYKTTDDTPTGSVNCYKETSHL